MQREIYSKLKEWKNSPYRKPLVMSGARQVGKSYIIKEFGKHEPTAGIWRNCWWDLNRWSSNAEKK